MYTLGDMLKLVEKDGFFVSDVTKIDEFAGINVDTDAGRSFVFEILKDYGLTCFPKVVATPHGFTVENQQNSLEGKQIVLVKQ